MQTTNAAGRALIREFEGCHLTAYPDPAHGWSVPTIGVGHTSAAGPPKVTRGMTITADEADDILARDLGKFEAAVRSLVHVPLTDNQFAALVSFAFNLGPGNLSGSTLLRKLNRGDTAGAAAEFAKWNRAGGKVMRGLTRRRIAERDLFLTPDKRPEPKPIQRPVPKPAPPAPALRAGPPGITVAGLIFGAALAAFAFIKWG